VDPSAEALAEEEQKEEAPATPWGTAIGAAIAINLVTLSGVVFLVPAVSALSQRYKDSFAAVVAAFATGALLSCAFNVLLFESTHLIAAGGFEDEAAVTWRWGTMILVGFLTPAIIDCALGFVAKDPHPEPALRTAVAGPDPDSNSLPALLEAQPTPVVTVTHHAPAQKDPEAGGGSAAPAAALSFRERARLINGVLVGDFCHNLCDGIFVGAAFRACGAGMGWSVASGTVIHEVAQELSDYAILVSPTQGGLGPPAALALNFLSGFSVVLGTVIVLASDVSDASIGLILAFGGGVYIHVGATECMPRVYRLVDTSAARLLALLAFVLGAVAVALVLLNHEHCSAAPAGAAAADPHAGHNH
jgi:zinc transporter ZupT